MGSCCPGPTPSIGFSGQSTLMTNHHTSYRNVPDFTERYWSVTIYISPIFRAVLTPMSVVTITQNATPIAIKTSARACERLKRREKCVTVPARHASDAVRDLVAKQRTQHARTDTEITNVTIRLSRSMKASNDIAVMAAMKPTPLVFKNRVMR